MDSIDYGLQFNFIHYFLFKTIRSEVEAVVSVSERNIVNHSFNLVESFFESIPQGIIQLYIACILDDADIQLNTWTESAYYSR